MQPPAKRFKGTTADACVVCLSEDACMLIRECDHTCLCVNCSFSVFLQSKHCPLCRTPLLCAPLLASADDESSKTLMPSSVNDAVTYARVHLEGGSPSSDILRSMNGIASYVSESSMKKFVHAYQLYSPKVVSALVNLALNHADNVVLQEAVATECNNSPICETEVAVPTLLDARCSQPIAMFSLRLLECGMRTGLLKPPPAETFAAIDLAIRRHASWKLACIALCAAATASTKVHMPAGAIATIVRSTYGQWRGHEDIDEKISHVLGIVVFSSPEPRESWDELVAVAKAIVRSDTRSPTTISRVLRFFTHAALKGAGSWDDLSDENIVRDCVLKAKELQNPSINKWLVAISESILSTKKASKSFLAAGGFELLSEIMEGELSTDRSSVRKFVRVVKELAYFEDLSQQSFDHITRVMSRVCSVGPAVS